MRVAGVIPARYRSSRLEGKPLVDILGKPMVQHVWERALRSGCLDEVILATGDEPMLNPRMIAPIPFPRRRTAHFRVYEQIGLYAYTRECLLRMASLPASPLEEVESLEQLRALENGIPIFVVETQCREEMLSVDTFADLERVRSLLLEYART